jgi:aldehyde dehydrogenase (NAD+)
LNENFRKGLTRPLAWRRNQLHNLARMAQDNAEAFAQALATDLGRPKMEAYFAEVGAVIQRCLLSAEKLEEWVKPETPNTPDWQKAWSAKVYKASKGTILVIA